MHQVIAAVRHQEIGYLRKNNYIKGSTLSFYFVASSITMLTTFVTYQQSDHVLTAYSVFTCYAYFNAMRRNIALFLALGIHTLVELRVGLRRIEDFLRLPEQSSTAAESIDGVSSNGVPFVALSDVSCAWVDATPVLQHLSVRVDGARLLCVAGPVGCGKTTLLMSILREISPISGTVSSRGSIAYASQEPWILTLSIRENILFGEPFDEDWYLRVIEACALNSDISSMPAGDATEIGERGVTLSGGQKARLEACHSCAC